MMISDLRSLDFRFLKFLNTKSMLIFHLPGEQDFKQNPDYGVLDPIPFCIFGSSIKKSEASTDPSPFRSPTI